MAKPKVNKKSPLLVAFGLLTEILENPRNQQKLSKAFKDLLEEDPIAFYLKLIKPMAEKTAAAQPVNQEAVSGASIVFSDEQEKEVKKRKGKIK